MKKKKKKKTNPNDMCLSRRLDRAIELLEMSCRKLRRRNKMIETEKSEKIQFKKKKRTQTTINIFRRKEKKKRKMLIFM